MSEPVIIKNTAKIRVRYAETDKMGFVYNGNYLTYFEVARVEMMRNSGLSYSDLEEEGYQLPLVEAHVNYKNAAHFDDLLEVESTLTFELKPIMKITYNIFRNNTTIATGHTVHSFFNAKLQRAVKPPKIFIEAMEKNSLNMKKTEEL